RARPGGPRGAAAGADGGRTTPAACGGDGGAGYLSSGLGRGTIGRRRLPRGRRRGGAVGRADGAGGAGVVWRAGVQVILSEAKDRVGGGSEPRASLACFSRSFAPRMTFPPRLRINKEHAWRQPPTSRTVWCSRSTA